MGGRILTAGRPPGAFPGPPGAEFPFRSPRAALCPRCARASRARPALRRRCPRCWSAPGAEGRAPGLPESSGEQGSILSILSILSSREEQAPRQLPFPEKMLRPRRSGSPRLPETATSRPPRPFAASFCHERKVLSVLSLSPPFGTAPGLEGTVRAGAGWGGEWKKGGVISYLFIYLAPSSLRSPW